MFISVTEGELFVVKVCDLPSEIENNISLFSYAFTLLCWKVTHKNILFHNLLIK